MSRWDLPQFKIMAKPSWDQPAYSSNPRLLVGLCLDNEARQLSIGVIDSTVVSLMGGAGGNALQSGCVYGVT
jgi:hypothetical protein